MCGPSFNGGDLLVVATYAVSYLVGVSALRFYIQPDKYKSIKHAGLITIRDIFIMSMLLGVCTSIIQFFAYGFDFGRLAYLLGSLFVILGFVGFYLYNKQFKERLLVLFGVGLVIHAFIISLIFGSIALAELLFNDMEALFAFIPLLLLNFVFVPLMYKKRINVEDVPKNISKKQLYWFISLVGFLIITALASISYDKHESAKKREAYMGNLEVINFDEQGQKK